MYIINKYQLIPTEKDVYLSNFSKGVKIPSKVLASILEKLQAQENLEISDSSLIELAEEYKINPEQLKSVLINKLNVLKPEKGRKFPRIVINSDDALVTELMKETLDSQYTVAISSVDFFDFDKESLVIFYRNNYAHDDFKKVYRNLQEDTYLVTAGVIHKLLFIDNIYIKNMGLPSHFSNLNQLLTYLKSDIPSTKNNWLLFYRELMRNQVNHFPEPDINACQRGYIAYCLNQFLSQVTDLWQAPTPMDQLNWLWQADLSSFSVHTEVAVHSPFSEYDMQLNLSYADAHQQQVV